MPSNISKGRLSKAFNEGRRSAPGATAENPYDPKLRRLWDQGRAREQAGEMNTPIPPLAHGETRAQRAPRNPPTRTKVPERAAHTSTLGQDLDRRRFHRETELALGEHRPGGVLAKRPGARFP